MRTAPRSEASASGFSGVDDLRTVRSGTDVAGYGFRAWSDTGAMLTLQITGVAQEASPDDDTCTLALRVLP